jgi:hypothetical protein
VFLSFCKIRNCSIPVYTIKCTRVLVSEREHVCTLFLRQIIFRIFCLFISTFSVFLYSSIHIVPQHKFLYCFSLIAMQFVRENLWKTRISCFTCYV